MAVLSVYKDGKLQLVLGDQTPVRHHDERIASGAMERIASGVMELGSQEGESRCGGFRGEEAS